MERARIFLSGFILLLLSGVAVVYPSQPSIAGFQPEKYKVVLFLTDAALDDDGNLYVIVNTWTTPQRNLRRILPDRKLDEKFRLERIDNCCTVNPYLVDTDAEGNIYVMTLGEWADDFMVAKYTPDGILDEDFAADGVLEYQFENPIDLEVHPTGYVYVLDIDIPEVFVITPDGSEVRGFVLEKYSLQRPAKLEIGPDNRMFLFDRFDPDFSRYEILQGIVALNPDGTEIEYFGYGWGGINSGADPLNYLSFVIDHDGSIWVLGDYFDSGGLSGAYHFDKDGDAIDSVPLEYQLGDDFETLGIIADNESGFITFEIDGLSLIVLRYTPEGKVRERFSVEVFKRKI